MYMYMFVDFVCIVCIYVTCILPLTQYTWVQASNKIYSILLYSILFYSELPLRKQLVVAKEQRLTSRNRMASSIFDRMNYDIL